MKHSGEKLKELRQTLGLSQPKMAKEIGVSVLFLGKYEKGTLQQHPNSSAVKVIDDYLAGKSNTNIFELNHCYQIREKTNHGGGRYKEVNISIDRPFTFRYTGKQGVHHCFREIRGGWARTYTDAQLIGKVIKEVIS